MAHLARLGLLTDELISALTGITEQNDSHNFRICKEFARRKLRHHNYGRTNQFEVSKRLDGLQEKLSILNRDELADALEDRRNEDTLKDYQWAPEALSLLLELSDRPAINSNLQDLEALKPAEPPPPLTWEEILAEEQLDEEGIWDEVDFGADTSEDEDLERKDSDRNASGDETEPSSVAEEEDETYNAPITTLDADHSLLDGISKAQFWKHRTRPENNDFDLAETAIDLGKTWKISEMQALREVLFMLSSLPTSLFSIDPLTGYIKPIEKYALGHTSYDSFQELLAAFANFGMRLQALRQWTQIKQNLPLLQSLNASICKRLRILQQAILQVETRYVSLRKQAVVSLVNVYHQLQTPIRPLMKLADLLPSLKKTADGDPFKCLEILFEQASLEHLAGDDVSFSFMANLFLECFQTYLRPIRAWMENGELTHDEEDFFIGLSKDRVEKHDLWHDQYFLRQDQLGKLHAPEFLHAMSKKIFNTGKSVVFLRRMGVFDNTPGVVKDEPQLDYTAVCGTDSPFPLAPFAELFDLAFDRWLDSKHHSASAVLRDILFSRCGLPTVLDALEYIYFLKDGSLYANMLTVMFEKIERKKDSWNDRFLLTEQLQSALASLNCINPTRLTFRSTPASSAATDISSRYGSLQLLSSIAIEYTLPWPIANIITRRSITGTYQRVFTFLLQIRNARYLLERRRLLKRDKSNDSNTDTYQLLLSLRHRLLWLVNTLYSYLTETVIVSTVSELRTSLNAAKDVDAMVSAHEDFATKLQDRCLLSRKLAPIYKAIISLLDLTVQFSDVCSATEADMSGDRHSLLSVLGRDRYVLAGRAKARELNRRAEDARYASTSLPRPSVDSDSDTSDSDDEMDMSATGANTVDASSAFFSGNISPAARLREMRAKFDRLCGFAAAGLHGVSRAGGEASWEILAEMLDWGAQPSRKGL